MTLDEAFTAGRLTHPLDEREANSVDLFRALSLLSGGRTFGDEVAVALTAEMVGHHDHYLFVLVDGLGTNLGAVYPSGGFLSSVRCEPIRSVFPSTTAVALTSLATGAWPAEHGLAGWFTYFPGHRRVLAPLWFRERGTRLPGRELGLSMTDLVAQKPLLGSFFRAVTSFLPQEITGGEYASWSRGGTPTIAYRSFGHAARLLSRHLRRTAGPSYTYLYLLTVDKLSHEYGVRSSRVAEEVARVDRLLSRIADAIPPNVRMIVTADHGLTDVPEENRFLLRDADPLARQLVAGPTGEGRTPVFHLRSGAEDAFLRAFADHPASRCFELHRPEELASRGLYGRAPLSAAARDNLGDLVALSVEPAVLQYVPSGAEPIHHVAAHGGLLPDEVSIPLFLLER